MKKRILFLTGTRADFGKLKPLMLAVENSSNFECLVFVTGMHLLSKYGLTVEEVQNAKFKNIYTYVNQMHGEPMELILANTINGLSRYVHEYRPDLIVVHGDRVEALAGAIIGALSNILVAHIEGGEISGTVDEIMRHAVSKLSHVHFVANEVSANRLIQLGEARESIYIIGSPEIDIMLSNKLPKIKKVKQRYGISFARYGIVLFHPVTTEVVQQRKYAQELVAALISSKQNFVVIYPNNDLGSDEIFDAYGALKDRPGFKILPSMRFEYFLSLLKHTRIIVGNSSVGMREAPVYSVPSVNIGSRQENRFNHTTIVNVEVDKKSILRGINLGLRMKRPKRCCHFGDGKSASRFIGILNSASFWKTPQQKQFRELKLSYLRGREDENEKK